MDKFNNNNEFLMNIVKSKFIYGKTVAHERKSMIFHEEFVEDFDNVKSGKKGKKSKYN